jgi:hypothetical protein
MHKKKIFNGEIGFCVKGGANKIIEKIDPFPILLRFVSTSNIQCYIHPYDFKELRTIEMATIEILYYNCG